MIGLLTAKIRHRLWHLHVDGRCDYWSDLFTLCLKNINIKLLFYLQYALYKVMDAPSDSTVVSSLAYSKLSKKLFYIMADI